jgi:hypothetical protein
VHGADQQHRPLSRLISLLTLSVALAGSAFVVDLDVLDLAAAELSALLGRRSSLKPFSIAVPSAAKVPVAGSMRPTLILPDCACAIGMANADAMPAARVAMNTFGSHGCLLCGCSNRCDRCVHECHDRIDEFLRLVAMG